jgi:hypothetical protein
MKIKLAVENNVSPDQYINKPVHEKDKQVGKIIEATVVGNKIELIADVDLSEIFHNGELQSFSMSSKNNIKTN